MNWGFWVVFLLPLGMGGAAGWWLRGLREDMDQADRARLMREVEQAKLRHPAFKAEGQEWMGWTR